MVRSIQRKPGRSAGGILSLAEFAEDHHKALEFDLMKCGFELKDVGRSLSWGALHSFITNMGPDTATARELDPEWHQWSSTMTTNKILADIYDMLAMINANLVAAGSHKAAKKPKPYPRPGKKNGGEHYGKGAIPVSDLRKMYAEKRKRRKHG